MSLPTGSLHLDSSGEVFALDEVSTIGRSRSAGVPIPDPRVSRQHAMIRRQTDGFWFFDLGSINGSSINGRRVTTSQLLVPEDLIQIADHIFRFEGRGTALQQGVETEMTIADVRTRKVILLVSDIQGFTTLSNRLSPERLAPIIGSWYGLTEAILERHGATLDKFIGDCVLAYWLDTSEASRRSALRAAHEMKQASAEVRQVHSQVLNEIDFTFGSGTALHLGSAAHGAFGSGEFTLLGDAVNLTFRLEALTRTLDQLVLVSADLLSGWSEGARYCRSLGSHEMKDLKQAVEVYALEGDPSDSE